MKNLTIVLLVTLLLASLSNSASAITFGEVDVDNNLSNVGAIVILPRPGSGDSPRVICSGTLVHSRVLLTAGHCTVPIQDLLDLGVPLWAFRVSFAVDALDETSWLDIEDVVTHPNYNYQGPGGTGNPRDLGAIILEEHVMESTPALLPDSGFLDLLDDLGDLAVGNDGGTPLLVAGYGSQLDFAPPEKITPDGLRRYVFSEFRALTPTWLVVSQNPALDNGGAGSGDSGGPTFWIDPETGVSVLIAVTGWGDAKTLAIDFHYRTDIAETQEFVESMIGQVEVGAY